MLTNQERIQYRNMIRDSLPLIVEKMNEALAGNNLEPLKPILLSMSPTGELPAWVEELEQLQGLTHGDGKTFGSICEKLMAAVVQKYVLRNEVKMVVNSGRGIDFPELKLSLKSPSQSYSTSEPFTGPYSRLLGSPIDTVVLVSNYQQVKQDNPICLQILKAQYHNGSVIADATLCALAKALRASDVDEETQMQVLEFLAHVNRNDWEAGRILKLIDQGVVQGKSVEKLLHTFVKDFEKANEQRMTKGKEPRPRSLVEGFLRILEEPTQEAKAEAIISLAHAWLDRNMFGFHRAPTEEEFAEYQRAPLNGKITQSYAIQWRFNLRKLFN